MKKYFALSVFGGGLILLYLLLTEYPVLHTKFHIIVIFFTVQTLILFQIEDSSNETLKIQIRLLNIGLRVISALIFLIAISFQLKEEIMKFYIQFIILYLAFMIFEITTVLTNLRRD